MVLHKQLRVINWSNNVKVVDFENGEVVLSGTCKELNKELNKSSYKDSFVKSINFVSNKNESYCLIRVKNRIKED